MESMENLKKRERFNPGVCRCGFLCVQVEGEFRCLRCDTQAVIFKDNSYAVNPDLSYSEEFKLIEIFLDAAVHLEGQMSGKVGEVEGGKVVDGVGSGVEEKKYSLKKLRAAFMAGKYAAVPAQRN